MTDPTVLADVVKRWRRGRLRAGRRLRDLRVTAELTQLELAARCGISNAQISRYERAKEAPRPEAVGRLATALGVAPEAFVTFPDDGLDHPAEPAIRFGEAGRLVANDAGELQCHLCGTFFSYLGKHASEFHGLTARQYRELADLKATTKLASAAVRDRIGEFSRARAGTEIEERFRAGAAASRARGATGSAPGRRISLEERLNPARRVASMANLGKAHVRLAERRGTPVPGPVLLRVLEEKTCLECGKTFRPKSVRRIFCGDPCRRSCVRRQTEAYHAALAEWGRALRACRGAAGLSAAALGRAVGSGNGRVSQLELGQAGPSADLVARLRAVLPDVPDAPVPEHRPTPAADGKRAR